MVRRLSLIFGAVGGLMGTAMFASGNLYGTPIFTNIRAHYPWLMPPPALFIFGGIASLAVAGFVTAFRSRKLASAIKVGALSGLIASAILFITGMGMTFVFHDAMMKDPGNIHEYQLSSPTPPTEEQLSRFLYWDALGGMLNMMWILPAAGAALGMVGGGTALPVRDSM